MKKTTQYAFLLYVFIFFLLPISCIEDCGPFPDRVQVSNLNWETLVIDLDTANNTYQYDSIYQNPIKYDRYAILIEPELEYLYAEENNETTFSSIPRAFACTEPESPVLKERLKDLQIVSSADYDGTHLSGDNVNDLFDIFVIENGQSIDQMDLNDYILNEPIIAYQFVLKLKSPPLSPFNGHFTIHYEQNGNGLTSASFQTSAVIILP